MKTLQQLQYEECSSEIKCEYPCDSCFGCKNQRKLIKEWLTQKRQHEHSFDGMLVLNELIKELEEVGEA